MMKFYGVDILYKNIYMQFTVDIGTIYKMKKSMMKIL